MHENRRLLIHNNLLGYLSEDTHENPSIPVPCFQATEATNPFVLPPPCAERISPWQPIAVDLVPIFSSVQLSHIFNQM